MKVIDPIKIYTKHFLKFWLAVEEKKYLRHVCKGGRNSSKSTSIALKIIEDIMCNPASCLVVRKVANTLERSVFEQLKEAINILGVQHLWKQKKSPLELIYTPRGNKIIFAGADDPAKIKSIKMSDFPLCMLWVEELAEFKNQDDITMIENSILRAKLPTGIRYCFFYSYNPPKRKQSWVNKEYETINVKNNTYVHHSTYIDNPFLSFETLEEIEHIEKTNKHRYEWEWLGKPIGGGIQPFDNLCFRKITDEEIKRFDNIKQGIDWGYATDPFCFVRMHYDKTRRKLFILDEIYGTKMSNRKIVEEIQKRKYNDIQIIADSAEPKSIDEVWNSGIKIIGARKGAGSIEYGEKWLNDLEEIVIDYSRTPNTAKEFENIDYKLGKNGDQTAQLEDKDNHSIDAIRYAVEDISSEKIKFLK